MIDMHSHILYGIDDGAKTKEDSIKILEEAYNAGFNKIFLTSHYIENDSFNATPEIRDALKNELKDKTEIELYSGSEVYVSSDLKQIIKEEKVQTLNNSRYVLIELPMNNKLMNIDDIIYDLLSLKLVPIIAHPERYAYVQENPNYVYELIQKGVLFQANYGSFSGIYGKTVRKTAENLIKNNMIHFLGTDNHRQNTIYAEMNTIIKEIEKLIGKDKFYQLSEENPQNVVDNKVIAIDEPIRYKKRLFSF